MFFKPNAGKVLVDNHRFRTLVAGRRFGKTRLIIAELIKAAHQKDSLVWYIAPSYRMAKQICWQQLKAEIPKHWIRSTHETDLSIVLINGSCISLRGCDNKDALRGVGLWFVAFDEFDFLHPDVWPKIIRPMLSTTNGRALFCGTPDGYRNLYDLYLKGKSQKDADWSSHQFTTLDGGWVPKEEIEAAKSDMDIKTFRQEYLASFETAGGRVAYNFSREKHVKPYVYPKSNLSVAIDFNVSPMCAAILSETIEGTHVVDEIIINDNGNTQDLADEIRHRYGTNVIDCYPDPAGSARHTSNTEVGRSDHAILKLAGFNVLSKRSTISIKDGINAINTRLLSADGRIHMYVSPNCVHTIKCLEQHSYKRGTSIPDNDGWEHMFSALRYYTNYKYPVKKIETWAQ